MSYVHDGEPDDCANDCSTGANIVQLTHPDGTITQYGHLKTWSITVAVGDSVVCGQKLGEMGSSGQSSGPHLHFGAYANGAMDDPFQGPCNSSATRWVDQGPYQGLPGLVCDTSGGGGGCGSFHVSGHLAWLALPPVGLLLARRRRRD